MDNFRIKIRDFFNQKWRNSLKSKYCVNLTYSLTELIGEYERVYGTKMSQSQLLEFLVDRELNLTKPMLNYSGDYLSSNISKLKTEYELKSHGVTKEYYDEYIESDT